MSTKCEGVGTAKGCRSSAEAPGEACEKLNAGCARVGAGKHFCSFCQTDFCNEKVEEEDEQSV
jgi:hypothetical protein